MAQSALSSPLTLKNTFSTKIPKLIYGTAWKKDRSADLVYLALKSGFRAIDTAAQPRHYQEKLVGDGIRRAINEGIVTREELYIQTKFTSISGQDPHNAPYDPHSPLASQIHTSIASSLTNLSFSPNPSETYIDCLVLHSPLPSLPQTLEAWEIFSTYVPHRIRALGISNTDLSTLQSLSSTSVPPSVVQNRFYADTRFEVKLRAWCREKGVVFQSFWTFTGNPRLMERKVVKEVAGVLKKLGVGEESEVVALYGLVMGLEGICVLDGTTREERMSGDLRGLQVLGEWAEGEGRGKWEALVQEFKGVIGEI